MITHLFFQLFKHFILPTNLYSPVLEYHLPLPLKTCIHFSPSLSFLLYQGSGNKDKLCLVCWSCLSSSPLPTVLKEHTRRWLNTLNTSFLILATYVGVPQWHVVKSDDWATAPHRSACEGIPARSSTLTSVWLCECVYITLGQLFTSHKGYFGLLISYVHRTNKCGSESLCCSCQEL